ncbi:MAG: helix-turn-helix domain-containing protein [Euzebya sp.]
MAARSPYRVSDPASFGPALADLRAEFGWTQAELAEWSGLNRTYLSGLEGDEPTIALRRLMAAISTLGYEITLTPKAAADEEQDW